MVGYDLDPFKLLVKAQKSLSATDSAEKVAAEPEFMSTLVRS